MKNKIIKIFIVLVSVIIVFCIGTIQVQAIDDPMIDPTDWKPGAMSETGTHFKPIVKNILGVINAVGVVISVAVLMVIGIRYIMGSAEEKAEYKKTIIGYVIGALMLFSLTTIPNILYTIGTSI